MTVVHIRTSCDLPTPAQNRLRYAIELGQWRREWREAEETQDWQRMDMLQAHYEWVGLP